MLWSGRSRWFAGWIFYPFEIVLNNILSVKLNFKLSFLYKNGLLCPKDRTIDSLSKNQIFSNTVVHFCLCGWFNQDSFVVVPALEVPCQSPNIVSCTKWTGLLLTEPCTPKITPSSLLLCMSLIVRHSPEISSVSCCYHVILSHYYGSE